MTLSINIDGAAIISPARKLLDVYFVFNNEYEKCSLPVDYWRIYDYISQWISGLSHVIDSGFPGALITSIHDPSIAANLVAWVLYPLGGGSVKIQQHFLMHERFVIIHQVIRYELLLHREVESSDGEEISEWTVSIDDLIAARGKLRQMMEAAP